MATPQDFARALLNEGDFPVTDNNIAAVVAWVHSENGHWGNAKAFNPLNTGDPTGGLLPLGDGVTKPKYPIQIYPSWNVGIEATRRTLYHPLGWHSTIKDSLLADKPAAETLLAIIHEPAPRWGTDFLKEGDIPALLSNLVQHGTVGPTHGDTKDPNDTALVSVVDLWATAMGDDGAPGSYVETYNTLLVKGGGAVAEINAGPPPATVNGVPWADVSTRFSWLVKKLGGKYFGGKDRDGARALANSTQVPPYIAVEVARLLGWITAYKANAPLPDPFGPWRVRPLPTPSRLPDPFITLSPQARDRAQIALRDQGGPPGESGRPILPGSNPMGIPMGGSPRPRFDVGPGPRLGRQPGDTPWVAPKPKPFAPSVGPNPPTPGPDRRADTGPNPAPQKKNRASGPGGSPAPNPPAERSTDSKSASIESRSDPKPATETKTETPTATTATDQKAPPPTEPTSGGGTTGGGGTNTDPKDDKKSTDGTKDSKLYAPIWPSGSGMPNPEDDGSGGRGGPRANLNPEDRFGAGDDEFKLPTFGDRVFDPKLFRFRVPGALGDMPSDEGGAGSGGGIGGPRSYGGQNQNPNPEDQGAGGGGGPRAYGNSSRSSLGGPRSYDAYPDPESTGGGGPRGRYNERPNPEDTTGPRGPNARNRSAIGPWSASRNRML